MRRMKALLIAGVAIVAVSALWNRDAFSAGGTQLEAQLTTPLGVTLQEYTGSGRVGVSADGQENEATAAQKAAAAEAAPRPFFPGGPRRNDNFMFADATGRTLYTYDKDTEKNKSSCVEKCAEAWPPLHVSAGAKPFGDWTIMSRDDKSKQWAFKGKPLYTFAKDTAAGQKRGEGAASGTWHVARFEAAPGLDLPYGMNVAESDLANGYVLANSDRKTIYMLDGSAPRGKKDCMSSTCPGSWTPVAAALIANPKGNFSLIGRADGFKQWAYKGKPLFTYSGDAAPGDTNGVGADKNFKVVLLAQHFTPKQAMIRNDTSRGGVVATANGMTLYRRDTSFHQPDGHGLPGSTPGSPAVGRAMGTKSCEDDCLKTWRPFVPTADAQSSGFWEIVARADGSKQWAYKGFALYTYDGDKKPGDKTGHDTYDILVSDNLTDNVYEKGPVNTTDSATMFWAYVEP